MEGIKDILEELDLSGLKDVARIVSLDLSSRRKSDYINELARHSWTEEQEKELIELVKQKHTERVDKVSYSIFRSDELPNLSLDDIKERLRNKEAKFHKNSVKEGFSINGNENDYVEGKYWYNKKRVIITENDVIRFRYPVSIPFKIKPNEDFIFVGTPDFSKACKIRGELQSILKLNRLYPACPNQPDGDLDKEQIKKSIQQFLQSLKIIDTKGVTVDVRGSIRELSKIKYNGHGDLFNEKKVKEVIGEGGWIRGFHCVVQRGSLKLDFQLNYGISNTIIVYRRKASLDIAKEFLEELFALYKEKFL